MNKFFEEKCRKMCKLNINDGKSSFILLRNKSEISKSKHNLGNFVRLGYNDKTTDKRHYKDFTNWKAVNDYDEIKNYIISSVFSEEIFASILINGTQYVNAYIDNFNYANDEIKIKYEYCVDAM